MFIHQVSNNWDHHLLQAAWTTNVSNAEGITIKSPQHRLQYNRNHKNVGTSKRHFLVCSFDDLINFLQRREQLPLQEPHRVRGQISRCREPTFLGISHAFSMPK